MAVWRFAEFELDSDNHVLRKNGTAVKLPPQPFKILLVLVAGSGALVRREDLCRAVWSDDVTVDFEHGLNTCMRQVRAALDDDAQAPRIIETVPRLGYRLKVPALQHVPARLPVRLLAGRRTTVAYLCVAAIAVAMLVPIGPRPEERTPLSKSDELIVRGYSSLERGTQADVAHARRLFGEAANLNPASPSALAGIGLSYLTHPVGAAGVPPEQGRTLAAGPVNRAVGLEKNIPAVGIAAAELKLRTGDWIGAAKEFQRTIERAPQDASVREKYATALALQGRLDDALREARVARDLDPLSPRTRSTLASTLRFARRYEEAKTAAEEALALDPTYGPALHTLALCYQVLGDVGRAIQLYEREGQPTGNLGHAYARAGRIADARQLLRMFERRYAQQGVGAGAIAQIYVGLGEYDLAFEWLARQVVTPVPTTLRVAEIWDPLRSDPRFHDVLAKLDVQRIGDDKAHTR